MIELSVELAATGMTDYTGEALPVIKLVDITDEVRSRGAYVRVIYTRNEHGEDIAIVEVYTVYNNRLDWITQIRAACLMEDLRDIAHSITKDSLSFMANKLGIQKAKLVAIIEEGAPKD